MDQQHPLPGPPIPEIDGGTRAIPLKKEFRDQVPDGTQSRSPAAYPSIRNVRYNHVQDAVWNPAGRHAQYFPPWGFRLWTWLDIAGVVGSVLLLSPVRRSPIKGINLGLGRISVARLGF